MKKYWLWYNKVNDIVTGPVIGIVTRKCNNTGKRFPVHFHLQSVQRKSLSVDAIFPPLPSRTSPDTQTVSQVFILVP